MDAGIALELAEAADEEARLAAVPARAAAQEARRQVDRLTGERTGVEAAQADLTRQLELLAVEEGTAADEVRAAAAAAAAAERDLAEAEERLVAARAAGEAVIAEAETEARRAIAALERALGERRRELEVRTAALDERVALFSVRRAELAATLEERRTLAAGARGPSGADDEALGRFATQLDALSDRLGRGIEAAIAERDRRTTASGERLARLGETRRARDELEVLVTADRERRQRLEIDLAEARVREETAQDRVRREFDADPREAIVAEAPPLPPATTVEARVRQLERELAALGPVNPLAAEELAALVDRRTFLDGQLDDVRSARRDLNRVIAAVDAQIVEAFTVAFADVERNFASLVATLFPGGSGRLHLSTPEDLLSSGVEIEARPAGRNVRRLSLLSGGERALVALGFLFAVFRSRPSPFYVLDEVEAALDDVNLGRFLALVDEFRADAQLLIVSHQKRTMEVADALYGISLQPGGASKVVSEKVERRGTRHGATG